MKLRGFVWLMTGLMFAVLASPAGAEDLFQQLQSSALWTPAPEARINCGGSGITAFASPSGSGSFVVYDDTNANCTGPRWPAGHSMCLEAVPAAGYDFDHWSYPGCPCENIPGPPTYPPLYFCCFEMPASLVICQGNFVAQ